MKHHPFFAEYINEEPVVIKRVCHNCMETVILAAGDVVFGRGEMPSSPKMYFVIKGTLDYVTTRGGGDSITLTEKMWIAEGVLWTRWRHKGTLTANGDVKLATLDAESFKDIVDK